jgi:GNAT superfamily N-acetyltransferase
MPSRGDPRIGVRGRGGASTGCAEDQFPLAIHGVGSHDWLVRIRDAIAQDAANACEILNRSIAELCFPDHRRDPEILAAWQSNKTPENFRRWIERPDSSVLVAVDGADTILAVGGVTDAGEITLNYVSPDARFCGVSRAMLQALEYRAAVRGATRCVLTSTQTARRFYLGAGYAEDSPPVLKLGIPGYPMAKLLSADTS